VIKARHRVLRLARTQASNHSAMAFQKISSLFKSFKSSAAATEISTVL
jgi:hypothetical protein